LEGTPSMEEQLIPENFKSSHQKLPGDENGVHS
jgi:hypothetical protein